MDRVGICAQKAMMIFSMVAVMLITLSAHSWAATSCSDYGGTAWADNPTGDAVGQIMAIITYDSESKPDQLAGIHLVGYLNGTGNKNCFGIAIKEDARASQLLSTALAAYMAGKTVLIRAEKSVVQYIWIGKP